jgi:hypothetical protein
LKEYIIKKFFRNLLTPSLRYELRENITYLKELRFRLNLWSWELKKIPPQSGKSNSILYLGRRSQREMALLLLGVDRDSEQGNSYKYESKNKVVICEMPFPGAICVPNFLSTVLPLDRPIEELILRMNKEKLRFYQKNRESYHFRLLLDDEEIEHIEQTMLRPFAANRYGEGAAQLDTSQIKKLAKDRGAFTLVYFNNEEIACHIGYDFSRKDKRYWNCVRLGYPEKVFSDTKVFGQTNIMNNFLQIEWLRKKGFDFYDIGISLARPNDGLIQWKRAYRGNLDTMENYNYFYVCPPKTNTCQFFWETPLFGLEHKKLVLHLGKPNSKTDDDFISSIQKMGFGGLYTVYLHCEHPPSDTIQTALKNIYDHLDYLPQIKVIYHAQ